LKLNLNKKSTHTSPPTADETLLERAFNAAWRERLCRTRGWRKEKGEDFAVLTLASGSEILVRAYADFCLDQLRTKPPYYYRLSANADLLRLERPDQLLSLLPGEPSALAELCEEARQCSRLITRFLDHTDTQTHKLSGRLLASARDAAAHKKIHASEYLERWVTRGHPIYPASKTRQGFVGSDIEQFSPELGGQFNVEFVAVKKTHLIDICSSKRGHSRDYPNQWLTSIVDSQIRGRASPSEYDVLAVHPWQMRNVITSMFSAELSDRTLVPLDCSFPVQALTSLRTLAPISCPDGAQIKVPLNVRITTIARTLSAPTVQNSPRLFDALADFCQRNESLAATLNLAHDSHGRHFWSPSSPPQDRAALEKSRHLSMLFRHRLEEKPGQILVPNALLTEYSPIDGRPVICELVDSSGKDPQTFIYEYALLSSRIVLNLLARMGLALEAHGQNTLTYFRCGQPTGWAIRDLGGVKIYRPYLLSEGFDVPLHPASLTQARDVADLVMNVHHTWLQNHIGFLLRALSHSYRIMDQELWESVRAATFLAWSEITPHIDENRRRELERHLFGPYALVKALTRMRLSGRPHDDIALEIPNPLHGL
jgi:siderophore synthetase component